MTAMSTEVWYRKWRPQRFSDLVGQEPIARTLANAVAAQRLSHAYLFCGPRGTGKTSTARILAMAANCQNNEAGEPCNRCQSCRDIADGRALDLIEMDAASNRGIDEIRSIRDKVGFSPNSSTFKVYLIDEVHELTQHAFDALLKTLEEPPPHVIFILATTEAERVPVTIISRCQRHDFRRIRVSDVVTRLDEICRQEGVQLPDGSLAAIGRKATGSLRDAVNLLEQVAASCGSDPSLDEVRQVLGLGGEERARQLVRHATGGDLAGTFQSIAAARDDGIDMQSLQRAMLLHLRGLLLVKAGAESTLEVGEEALNELRSDAVGAETDFVLRLLRLVSLADFRTDSLSPLPLELALAEAIHAPAIVQAQPVASQRAPIAAARPPSAPRSVPDVLRSRPTMMQRQDSGPRPAAMPRSMPSSAGNANESGRREINEAELDKFEDRSPATALVSGTDPPHFQAAEGEVTLGRLQDSMGTVYDRLRERRSVSLAALLNSGCNIMNIDAETVTLAFRHDTLATKFSSDEGGKHIREVEDVLAAIVGRHYAVKVTVDPSVQPWRRPTVAGASSHLLDEATRLGLRRIERTQPG